MHQLVVLGLEDGFRRNAAIAARLPALEEAVRQGRATPFAASRELLVLFGTRVN
jgi:hypothetical protein